MNLKYSLLLCVFAALLPLELRADITNKPSPLPPSTQKLTFKQKWRKFFQNVSDDFHMQDRTTRQADKYHENLRKPKENRKMSRKERRALEKARKQALQQPSTGLSSPSYQPYGGEVVQPIAPAPQARPAPEPLAMDPVKP